MERKEGRISEKGQIRRWVGGRKGKRYWEMKEGKSNKGVNRRRRRRKEEGRKELEGSVIKA